MLVRWFGCSFVSNSTSYSILFDGPSWRWSAGLSTSVGAESAANDELFLQSGRGGDRPVIEKSFVQFEAAGCPTWRQELQNAVQQGGALTEKATGCPTWRHQLDASCCPTRRPEIEKNFVQFEAIGSPTRLHELEPNSGNAVRRGGTLSDEAAGCPTRHNQLAASRCPTRRHETDLNFFQFEA